RRSVTSATKTQANPLVIPNPPMLRQQAASLRHRRRRPASPVRAASRLAATTAMGARVKTV
ncbi:hypothetical protein, partial [Microcoleus anatoxicus]|uniref:hypothetical protein n=1 Tax=Microcoleus anatoxicus TaxID=2705319 RepID=UPI0030C99172